MSCNLLGHLNDSNKVLLQPRRPLGTPLDSSAPTIVEVLLLQSNWWINWWLEVCFWPFVVLTFSIANCQMVSQLFLGFLASRAGSPVLQFSSSLSESTILSTHLLLDFWPILGPLPRHSVSICLSVQLSIPAIEPSVMPSLFCNQLVIKFQMNNVSGFSPTTHLNVHCPPQCPSSDDSSDDVQCIQRIFDRIFELFCIVFGTIHNISVDCL